MKINKLLISTISLLPIPVSMAGISSCSFINGSIEGLTFTKDDNINSANCSTITIYCDVIITVNFKPGYTFNTVTIRINNKLIDSTCYEISGNDIVIKGYVVTSKIIHLDVTSKASVVPEPSEHFNYIYNRTFSIVGKKDNEFCFGTGWLVSDATESDPNDYTYWLATNWHVTHGFDTLYANKFYYGDSSLYTSHSFINHDEYKLFSSFEVDDENKFCYSKPSGQFWKPCIDMRVVKVDFGSPTGKIKAKLDEINKFNKQNGYINKFAQDSYSIRTKKKYIGGYPMKEGTRGYFGGQWEKHSVEGNSLYYVAKGTIKDGQNQGHAIGDTDLNQDGTKIEDGTEQFYYWDVSPQYEYIIRQSPNYMSGGASGSMMITEDYEVCGIYWGGWGIGNDFYPSFSLFNTSEKNFIAEYIK